MFPTDTRRLGAGNLDDVHEYLVFAFERNAPWSGGVTHREYVGSYRSVASMVAAASNGPAHGPGAVDVVVWARIDNNMFLVIGRYDTVEQIEAAHRCEVHSVCDDCDQLALLHRDGEPHCVCGDDVGHPVEPACAQCGERWPCPTRAAGDELVEAFAPCRR